MKRAKPASNPTGQGLSGEQKTAAFTLDRHVAVTAGPGAGKTRVLVARYLHILETHNDLSFIDKIVALTFTNRAANEMRERVRKELDARLNTAVPGDRDRWLWHKRKLDGAIITTIHGFCARLLREFPVEAEVDPQLGLLQEHEAELLLETVAEASLTERISSGERGIASLAAGVTRSQLVEALIGIYRAIRNQGLTLDRVSERTAAEHGQNGKYRKALGELDECMSEWIAATGLTDYAEQKRQDAEANWPHLRRLLHADRGGCTLAEYCHAVEIFGRTRPNAQRKFKELISSLDRLIWEDKLGGLVPQLYFDAFARESTGELLKTLILMDQRLEEEKRRISVLDFDDLQIRALRLLETHPEVLRRTAGQYRFFLVDEFQDTNGLQRELLKKLALAPGQGANVFIVADRKQSIYGFRGADVNVFSEMRNDLLAANGIEVQLDRNFRSQPPLINFFNLLFPRIFAAPDGWERRELAQLGYVDHEPSKAERETVHSPLIELLVYYDSGTGSENSMKEGSEAAREREAAHLATRIIELIGGSDEASDAIRAGTENHSRFKFEDVAMLFRAMTNVGVYESALRRAGAPFHTIQGKGFYQREEITDMIQLLRFLDNRTDDLALAAVLRSPLCGISDNALLALRWAPLIGEAGGDGSLAADDRTRVRNLLHGLRNHREIDFIDDEERPALDAAHELITELRRRSNRYRLPDLLRFALEASSYRLVAAATFDGAQRLANLDKLLALAEGFDRSRTHLIREFVRFVREFEEIGGREGEGQMEAAAHCVRLMSVHQAKGLEFPVVVIPELQRERAGNRSWYQLDRHHGLSVKVPDGAGGRLKGYTFERLRTLAMRREEFESMRLLYVAATRARDGVIFSGAASNLQKGSGRTDCWLSWLWKSLGLDSSIAGGQREVGPGVSVRIILNRPEPAGAAVQAAAPPGKEETEPGTRLPDSLETAFALLPAIHVQPARTFDRFGVTQLLNYRRCPRQFYFDRFLHVPDRDALAFWNDVEAPEPPANLTASVRGSVIHRFCETFQSGDDPLGRLKFSLEEVLRTRKGEWGVRTDQIDREAASQELLALANHYLTSSVRQRIDAARSASAAEEQRSAGPDGPGLFSECKFVLRRPGGTLYGSIDKLILSPELDGGLSCEIIDFKTNRFEKSILPGESIRTSTVSIRSAGPPDAVPEGMRARIEQAAHVYELQMQAYCLAVYELAPQVNRVRATLHFLDPNVEVSLPTDLLERDICAAVIDGAMLVLRASSNPEHYPARPADHCRFCNFLSLCRPGRQRVFRQKG